MFDSEEGSNAALCDFACSELLDELIMQLAKSMD